MKAPLVQYWLLVTVVAAKVFDGKFVSEKPDVLNPCMLNSDEFNQCFAQNVQVIFHEWKDGVPGFPSSDSLDPFFVQRAIIAQDPNSPVALDIDLYNVLVSGISDAIVNDASYDPYRIIAKFDVLMPKMAITCDYSVKGRILSIALNAQGKSYISIENFKIHLVLHLKMRDEQNYTFLDVEKLHLDIKEVNGLRIRLDNLFNGQQILEESIHAVFNEHWHEFYEVLKPSIQKAIESAMLHRFTAAFSHVPATFFIKDIPTIEKYITE